MIPDFQSIMLPLLSAVKDEQEHSTVEVYKVLGASFKLTEEELNKYLPSGNQKIFYNRVFWAKAHLKMAGLLENTKRAHFKITTLGKETLSKNPNQINIAFLKQFPGYKESISGSKEESSVQNNSIEETSSISETPQESLDKSFQIIKSNLEEELLSKVKLCTPAYFEKIVVDLLIKMGYGGPDENAGVITGKSGDEGIDGIIKQDPLGIDMIYIQAKKWDGVVGRPEIQKFAGALTGQGAKKGVFITTSRFSNEALQYLGKSEMKIVLIDGIQLARYMVDYSLGVSIQQTYAIKKIDSDYFEED
jgi:restriction system protein